MRSFFFRRQKKEKEQNQKILETIERLQGKKMGDQEFLDEIKFDLQEGMPLSEEKKTYLKQQIKEYKKYFSEEDYSENNPDTDEYSNQVDLYENESLIQQQKIPAEEKRSKYYDDLEEKTKSFGNFGSKEQLELQDIENLIKRLRRDKTIAYEDLKSLEAFHSKLNFKEKIKEMKKELEEARRGLDSIQSSVYEKNKEIRALHGELDYLQEYLLPKDRTKMIDDSEEAD